MLFVCTNLHSLLSTFCTIYDSYNIKANIIEQNLIPIHAISLSSSPAIAALLP